MDEFKIYLGKPEVVFDGTTKELVQELGITRVHVAITHDEHYVVANAILEHWPVNEWEVYKFDSVTIYYIPF